MAIVNRQAEVSGGRFESESKERDMTDQRQMRGAARFILQKRSALLAGLRFVPVAAMLIGVATMTPEAAATTTSRRVATANRAVTAAMPRPVTPEWRSPWPTAA